MDEPKRQCQPLAQIERVSSTTHATDCRSMATPSTAAQGNRMRFRAKKRAHQRI